VSAALPLSGDWAPAPRSGLPPLAAAPRQARRIARHVVEVTYGGDEPLIDFGAGAGVVADEVLAECGATPICIEPDPALAAGLAGRGHTVRRLADLGDGEARAFYSIHALSAIPDPADAMAAAARKLARDAPVLVYVPAFAPLHGRRTAAAGHARRCGRQWLVATLRQAGVRVIRSGYADSVGLLCDAALRLVRDCVEVTPRRARLYDACAFPVSSLIDPLLLHRVGANVWAEGVKA
jgi:hypothetical protein